MQLLLVRPWGVWSWALLRGPHPGAGRGEGRAAFHPNPVWGVILSFLSLPLIPCKMGMRIFILFFLWGNHFLSNKAFGFRPGPIRHA